MCPHRARVISTVTVARPESVIFRVRLAPEPKTLSLLIAGRCGRGIGAADAEDQKNPTVAEATSASTTTGAPHRPARVFERIELKRKEFRLPTGDRPCI